MTRGRFYGTAMPIYAILYVIALMAFDHSGKVAGIGAMGFTLIAVVGTAIQPDGPGRRRDRRRA